jgi:hypothetical protein
MPITDESTLIAALRAAPSNRTFNKATQTAEGAGTWHSLWKALGYPGAGANPPLFSAGSGYVPTKATTGAFPFTNAGTNGDLALLKLAASGVTAGTLIAYDRLWACSGFGTVITTAQNTVTPGALPTGRDPNTGLDVEPWLEVYTAPGAGTATWTLTGVDGNGNAARTWAYTHPANAESIGQMVPMMPGGGSPASVTGMEQLTSFTASATSGTAGDVGVTLLRRLASVPFTTANIGSTLDALLTGLPTVYNDAAVALMVQCSTTNTGFMLGEIVIG